MSAKPNLIYAIGDSQIRSIAYQKAILPFFIGGSAFNNFLTEKKAAKTAAKINAFLDATSGDELLLFIMNGDPTHFSVKTFKSENKISVDKLLEAGNRYMDLMEELSKSRSGKIVVCSSIIGAIENSIDSFEAYNQVIRSRCEAADIFYLDLYKQIIEDKKFKEEYRADWAHINQKIAPFVIDQLKANGLLSQDTGSDSHFEYAYLYDIPTKEGNYKLWGDFPVEKLQLGKKALKYNLNLHRNTAAHDKIIDLIGMILAAFTKGKKDQKLLIKNSREGFAVFKLAKKLDLKIIGTDPEPKRISTARILSNWFPSDKMEFHIEEDYATALKDDHISIDLFKQDAIEKLRESCLGHIYLAQGVENKTGNKSLTFNCPDLGIAGFEDTKIIVQLPSKASFSFRFFHKRWNLYLLMDRSMDFLKMLSKKPQKALDAYKFYKKNRKMKKFRESN